jgi:hypothetical protein
MPDFTATADPLGSAVNDFRLDAKELNCSQAQSAVAGNAKWLLGGLKRF